MTVIHGFFLLIGDIEVFDFVGKLSYFFIFDAVAFEFGEQIHFGCILTRPFHLILGLLEN